MKLFVAMSGASGQVYAHALLNLLASEVTNVTEVYVCQTSAAAKNAVVEGIGADWDHRLRGFGPRVPFKFVGERDLAEGPSSGSTGIGSVVVIPCSVGTLGRIASGVADNLVTRSATVQLKERRRLVLVLRETPLSLIDAKNIVTVTEAGGIVMPASPSFYIKNSGDSVAALVDQFVRRVCDVAGVEVEQKRWR